MRAITKNKRNQGNPDMPPGSARPNGHNYEQKSPIAPTTAIRRILKHLGLSKDQQLFQILKDVPRHTGVSNQRVLVGHGVCGGFSLAGPLELYWLRHASENL